MGSRACRSIISRGAEGILVDIECHVSNNLPTIIIIGFASKAVNEAKHRLRGAFASSGLKLPRKRITLNLAPADLQKSDSGLDLAMAIAILSVSGPVSRLNGAQAALGELGLDGYIRPVRGIIGKILAAREHGIKEFLIPADNLAQAQLVPGIVLFPASSLQQVYAHLLGARLITPVSTGAGTVVQNAIPISSPSLDEVVGQPFAKRALAIAAAGGHNILLYGPPGTGKSLLASTLASLLPPLQHEEVLEVTHLHSLAGPAYDRLFTRRPIQKPHHSTGPAAMLGNGIKPGEISLSHRGVLLLDELPEFNRATLEVLRQPLEDHEVHVAKAHTKNIFPAHFILAATANPCPCGQANSTEATCICSAAQLQRYRSRLSGALLDRIDLCCNVSKVKHQLLLDTPQDSASGYAVQVAHARDAQARRYGTAFVLNSDLQSSALRAHARLSTSGRQLLDKASNTLQLSSRGYLKVVKVARTIADMEDSVKIEAAHMSEALYYRQGVT